jgi:ZIP family zinc transporter
VLGTTPNYWFMRDQPPILKLALLALTAGTLLTHLMEDIISEAHQTEDARFGALLLMYGFARFALISV